MGGFLGSHINRFDEKGRISLPAPFRRGREDESFVLVHVHEDALSLYPEDSWVQVQEALREMGRRGPEYRPRILAITANAHEVTPDKQGRILVPDRLREGAGLGPEALIIGAIDRIEIWDPERFEEATSGKDDEFDRFVQGIFA